MQEKGPKRGTPEPSRRPVRTDAARSRLEALADKLGNDAMAERIARGRATQQDMIAFVTARLQRVAEVQLRERELVHRDTANWRDWREMGDHHMARAKEAAPERWGEVAQAYDRAIRAACRGELHQARQLVAQARLVEDRVLVETTSLVRTHDLRTDSPDPGWLADAVLLSSTQPTDVPTEARDLIRRILDIRSEMPMMRGKPRSPVPWWAIEEDEDAVENEEDD